MELKPRPTPEEIISRIKERLVALEQEETETLDKLQEIRIDQQTSSDDGPTQGTERALLQETLANIKSSKEEAERSLAHIKEHGLVCGIPGCGKDIETGRLLADEFPLACTAHRDLESTVEV